MAETYQEIEELKQRVVKLAAENERLEMIVALTDQIIKKLSSLCDIYKNLCDLYKKKAASRSGELQ